MRVPMVSRDGSLRPDLPDGVGYTVVESHGDGTVTVDVGDYEIRLRTDGLETRLGVADPWIAGEAVDVGDKRTYQRRIYGCIQAHTTQADWTPDVTPALWGDQGAAAPAPTEWVDELRDVRSQVANANNVGQLRDAVLAVVDTLTGDV